MVGKRAATERSSFFSFLRQPRRFGLELDCSRLINYIALISRTQPEDILAPLRIVRSCPWSPLHRPSLARPSLLVHSRPTIMFNPFSSSKASAGPRYISAKEAQQIDQELMGSDGAFSLDQVSVSGYQRDV